MTYELLAERASTRFILCSLSELWILHILDLFLAQDLRRLREELFILLVILVSNRPFNCSRVIFALPKIVIILAA